MEIDARAVQMLDSYNEVNRMDDTQIRADFNELCRRMNGMELREDVNKLPGTKAAKT